MNNICLRYTHSKKELEDMLGTPKSLFTCDKGCLKRHKDIKSILLNFGNLLRNQNIEVGDYLGSGACGQAYGVKHKPYILKITLDPLEVALAEILKTYQFQNVCKIIEVFKFSGTNYYGVIQQKLFPLDKAKDDALISVIESQIIKDILGRYIKGHIEMEEAFKFVRAAAHNICMYRPISKRQEALEALEQVLKAVKDIAPIAFPDLGMFNTMKKGSVFYLIDMKLRDDKFPIQDILSKIKIL